VIRDIHIRKLTNMIYKCAVIRDIHIRKLTYMIYKCAVIRDIHIRKPTYMIHKCDVIRDIHQAALMTNHQGRAICVGYTHAYTYKAIS
jgi:hypothetical protein